MRLLVLVLGLGFLSQDLVTLNSPVLVDPGATRFRVAELQLKRTWPADRGPIPGWSPAAIRASFREAATDGTFVLNGKVLECTYSGGEAETLIRALNKVDLSVKSLERRVLERCQQDGKLGPGALSGIPE